LFLPYVKFSALKTVIFFTEPVCISGPETESSSVNWAQQSRRVFYVMTETDSSLQNVVL